MKTLAIITTLLILLAGSLNAQTDSCDSHEYQIWVTTYDSVRRSTGVLFETRDSSVSILNARTDYLGNPAKPEISKINAGLIDVVKIRRKGSTGNGVIIGALTGLAVGCVIDLIYYSSWKNEEPKKSHNLADAITNSVERSDGYFWAVAVSVGLACMGTGAGIGAAVGSVKITIPINGSQEKFRQNKTLLESHSIVRQR
jgi:hypothetical protein